MSATKLSNLSYTQALRLLRSSSADVYTYMYRDGWGYDSVNNEHPSLKRYTSDSRRFLQYRNPITGHYESPNLTCEDIAATDWVVSNAVID